jgi:serine/threonine protein kinase
VPVSEIDEETRSDGAPGGGPGSRHVGSLAGRYKVRALLGAGGMGSVYLADDVELGERVAVKLLRPEYSLDAEFIDRLRSEVRLARRVTHKDVARTYDIGEHEGERFLTMEPRAFRTRRARHRRSPSASRRTWRTPTSPGRWSRCKT